MCGLFCYSYAQEKLEERRKNINSYSKVEVKEYDISLYNPKTNMIYKEDIVNPAKFSYLFKSKLFGSSEFTPPP